MVRLFLFLALFSVTQLAFAQPATDLKTPRSSVYTFLYHLQPDSYNPEMAAKPFLFADRTLEESEDLAIRLKRILDGKGIFIDLDEISNEANYFDSTSNRAIYPISPKLSSIYLSQRDGVWVFGSRAGVEIERAYRETFWFGTSRLLDLLPHTGTRKFFGIFMWQYTFIFLLLLCAFLLHKVFSLIFQRVILNALTRYNGTRIAKAYISPIARPLSLFVVFGFVLIMLPVVQLPAEFSRWIILVLRVAVPFFATVVFYRLVNVLTFYLKVVAERSESTLDDQLVPLVRKTLKAFVIVVGTFAILDSLEVDFWPLLTGLSIGGLAFALAAQDTIKNFFGSLMIFVDKPFQIGDWITSGDIDGSVEEVGFRSTRIRTFRNSVTYVPNGKLADSTIDNHGLRQYRRFFTHISLTYSTPTKLINAYVDGLKAIVLKHPDTRKDAFNIYLNKFSASSLDVMLYIFFEVPDWGAELKARHEIMIEAIDLAKELNVDFAFPTQTIHLGDQNVLESFGRNSTLPG